MKTYICFFILLAIVEINTAFASVPRIAVTIKPIYSLVCSVMKGAGSPLLVINNLKSSHAQALTMLQLETLRKAEVIFWIGPAYEFSLQRYFQSFKKQVRIVTLLDTPGIITLPARQGSHWGNHYGNHQHSQQGACSTFLTHCHGDNHHELSPADGHIWLDPDNAQAIVKVIATELAVIDPQHKALYIANSQEVIKKLAKLDEAIKKIIAHVKNKPYIVYHDSMQYFDNHFHTHTAGSLISCAHSSIKARHLVTMGQYIREKKIGCVFDDPVFSSPKIDRFVKQTGARILTLDTLGVNLPANEETYFLIMQRLAHVLVAGLTN